MFAKMTKKLITASALVFLSTQAFAGLILETYGSGAATPNTVGGYAMTDFAITNGAGGSTSAVASPLGGNLTFAGQSGAALNLNRGLANSTSWWNNGEANDYDIYTTDVSWIEIFLPKNTRAFSFNVGANLSSTRNNAWLTASESMGSGIGTHWFNVNRSNTPGFGIYADNSNNNCSAITSVIIDPDFWGVGNFSINQSECTASVPEPSSISMLVLGLIGLGALRVRQA